MPDDILKLIVKASPNRKYSEHNHPYGYNGQLEFDNKSKRGKGTEAIVCTEHSDLPDNSTADSFGGFLHVPIH